MKRYDYECRHGHVTTVGFWRKERIKAFIRCPECGARARRLTAYKIKMGFADSAAPENHDSNRRIKAYHDSPAFRKMREETFERPIPGTEKIATIINGDTGERQEVALAGTCDTTTDYKLLPDTGQAFDLPIASSDPVTAIMAGGGRNHQDPTP